MTDSGDGISGFLRKAEIRPEMREIKGNGEKGTKTQYWEILGITHL